MGLRWELVLSRGSRVKLVTGKQEGNARSRQTALRYRREPYPGVTQRLRHKRPTTVTSSVRFTQCDRVRDGRSDRAGVRKRARAGLSAAGTSHRTAATGRTSTPARLASGRYGSGTELHGRSSKLGEEILLGTERASDDRSIARQVRRGRRIRDDSEPTCSVTRDLADTRAFLEYADRNTDAGGK